MHIYADFNNRDASGFIRLNNFGTVADLSEKSIALAEGLRIVVSDGDLIATVIVHEPGAEQVWRGEIIGEIQDICDS